MVKQNLGDLDRVLRVTFGVYLVWLGWGMNNGFKWALLLLGLILAYTGLVGFCWIYKMLGMSTCGAECGENMVVEKKKSTKKTVKKLTKKATKKLSKTKKRK